MTTFIIASLLACYALWIIAISASAGKTTPKPESMTANRHNALAQAYQTEALEHEVKAKEHVAAGQADLGRIHNDLANCCRDLCRSHLRIAELEASKPM